MAHNVALGKYVAPAAPPTGVIVPPLKGKMPPSEGVLRPVTV